MKHFVLRSVLPTFLTISLFVFAIFFFTLPTLERSILEQKREMIRELTNSAWNILARFEYDEKTGTMTRQQAQQLAIEAVQNLHYGHGMKDYFWINDMHPRMIIHPYRLDLNGKDLSDIADPSGMKLFVKFVEVVKASGSGYLEYQWQWKDDSTRISPKLSYVKGFEPWGWIIGTGVYLNDVHQEIASIRNHVIFFSTLILLIVTALLSFLVADSYHTEKLRIKAEANLRASEEKYRILVESAGEYMIMSLCGQKMFANNSMLRLLGYSAEEFSAKDITQIVEMSPGELALGRPYSIALMNGETVPLQYETSLLGKDGNRCRVMISLSTIPQKETAGFLMIASELTAQQERVTQQDKLLEELQRSLLYFHQTIGDISSFPAILCHEDEPLEAIGKHFVEAGVNAVLISASPTSVKGFLSLQSFTKMIAGEKANLQTPVKKVILEQPVFVDENSLLFDAYLQHANHSFAPIFFNSSKTGSMRMLNERSFTSLQSYSPTCVLREIQSAANEEALIKAARIVPEMARIFIQNKSAISQVNRLITDVADMALARAIELAVQKHGKPPAEFCFLVMGSEGRREQTLCTDQDNAILYADVEPTVEAEVRQYFIAMGETVCTILNRCGYAFCKGGIMAKNPIWVQPLAAWKKLFTAWISTLEAEDLLQSKIFFDFRAVTLPEHRSERAIKLAEQLQQHLEAELEQNPRFFFLLARNILQYEPPLGLFGNFIVESKNHKVDVLDIKSVMSMMVDFSRIYALKHKITERNTHERLKALRAAGVLSDQSYYELKVAYSYLMRIRLDKQAISVDQGMQPDNFVSPEYLTSIDQKILKEIFTQIKNFQVKLSYDFTGMMGAG